MSTTIADPTPTLRPRDARFGLSCALITPFERSGAIESRWEEAESGRRRKYYRLTPSGRRQLADERRQWQTVDQALGRIWSSPTEPGDFHERAVPHVQAG